MIRTLAPSGFSRTEKMAGVVLGRRPFAHRASLVRLAGESESHSQSELCLPARAQVVDGELAERRRCNSRDVVDSLASGSVNAAVRQRIQGLEVQEFVATPRIVQQIQEV